MRERRPDLGGILTNSAPDQGSAQGMNAALLTDHPPSPHTPAAAAASGGGGVRGRQRREPQAASRRRRRLRRQRRQPFATAAALQPASPYGQPVTYAVTQDIRSGFVGFTAVSRRFAGVSRAFRGRFAQCASLQIDSHRFRTIHSFAPISHKLRKICKIRTRFTPDFARNSQPFRTVSRRFAALTRCESV